MALGGPMANSVMKKYIPGPGMYKNDTSTLVRDDHVPSLRSRLPDRSHNHLLKNPGPGAYKTEELGGTNYYIGSKHPDHTHMKISPTRRLDPIVSRSMNVGPGHCR